MKLLHQKDSRTLRRSQPTTGKSVGKPRLLPKCCHTTSSLPRGNRYGSHGAGTRTRSTRVRKSVGKPVSQMRMEAELHTSKRPDSRHIRGWHGVILRPQCQTVLCET